MRVALVAPNYLMREAFGEASDPPLGIAIVAAVLLEAGHDVLLIDANAEDISLDEVLERLRAFSPGMVGISCNYAPLHNPTIQLANAVRSEIGCFVFAGGNHASAMAEYLLERAPGLSAVVRGEGEPVVGAIADALEGSSDLAEVPGLLISTPAGIADTGRAPVVEDLDALPLPAYALLPMHRYARHNIMSSRGCPFSCSYCASNVVFSCRVRYRSPSKVAEEIEYLLGNYEHKHFWFSDDTFTSNRAYTNRLLDALAAIDMPFTWSCLTRVSVVDRALLERMKAVGCTYVSYGIESGHQGMLDAMGKRISVAEIARTLELTSSVGLRQYGFFIVGFPGETEETLCATYRLIATTSLDGAAFNVLIPLPGTSLMDDLVREGLLTLDEIEWDRLFARTPDEQHDWYSARLASRWTELSATELVEACVVGHAIPGLMRCLAGEAPKQGR